MKKNGKVAIVYDWIDKWGGVERVLLTLHEMFPTAEFFTSYYDSEKASWAKDLKIKTSFMERLPKFIRGNRIFSLPFYPYAFESFDFSTYDLVISVTSSFAKSVITKPGTHHICYLLTPPRFLWSHESDYFKNEKLKSLLSPYLSRLRDWDFVAAQRPDQIISISQTVANRCKKYYNRESEVVYPPFDTQYWGEIKKNVILGIPPKAGDSRIVVNNDAAKGGMTLKNLKDRKYFLVVSRQEPYKRVDLVVRTFTDLNENLIIVGQGSQLDRLKKMAGQNVSFYSRLTDQELGNIYSLAEALIMPQEEDFGLVSLEAQFFGCPVIAYKYGGASETVLAGKTGLLMEDQSKEALTDAIKSFNVIKYELRKNVWKFGQNKIERFNKQIFEKKFLSLVNSEL